MLTTSDIGLLMNALDALESQDTKDELLFSVMSIALAPPEAKEEAADEAKRKMEQQGKTRQVLAERIILLKAKLIQLKTTVAIDSVFMEQPG